MDWNKPHDTDAGWANAYRNRPRGCICEVEMNEIRGGGSVLLRRDYTLNYNRGCAFHFPELHQALKEAA